MATTKNAREIFLDALDRGPADRSASLDAACGGDVALRQQVEALLRAHDEPRAFLSEVQQGPPRDATVTFGDTTAGRLGPGPTELGTTIAGRYTLVEVIGEGGMGSVYLATQTEPVKRQVALKLIKTGMDSKAVLARFDAERQALAMMDHPNIARILDGGLTEDRRPYFVMELVNGLALTKFCDEARLTPTDRLELFVPICQAVQHAHQKGVVHRDLKPSNILITTIDGRPVPKVIDFGVAKATGGTLSEDSISTQYGAVVGTLEYMSPEQAGFSGDDIDTRADIYSLGVILYELLTGLRPIDAKRLHNTGFAEMMRVIQEVEPSRPSTRLSTDVSLESSSELRHTDPKRLLALLRGELDWVVMKCLEKDRDRRYETASGLARDIQRYLKDEAVEARPQSTGYRLNKFLKRNKVPVIAASLILFALLAGIAGTSWGLIAAKEQTEIAVGQKIRADEETAHAKALNGIIIERILGETKAASEDMTRILGEIVDGSTAKSKRVEFVACIRRFRRMNDTLRSLAAEASKFPQRQADPEEMTLMSALISATTEFGQQMQKLIPLAQRYPAEMTDILLEALQNEPKKK